MLITIVVAAFALIGFIVLIRHQYFGALVWAAIVWAITFYVMEWVLNSAGKNIHILSGIVATIVAGFAGGGATGQILNQEGEDYVTAQAVKRQRAADIARNM